MILYLSRVNNGKFYLDLSWWRVSGVRQLSQHDMNISVLYSPGMSVCPPNLREHHPPTYRGELQTVSEQIHQDATDATLLTPQCPALTDGERSSASTSGECRNGTYSLTMADVYDCLHVLVAVRYAGGVLMSWRRIHATDLAREHPRAVAYPTALRSLLHQFHEVDPEQHDQ